MHDRPPGLFAGPVLGIYDGIRRKNGQESMEVYTGSRLMTAPIIYLVDGKPYLTMAAGASVITFALPD